jgi:hypothetical protein
MIRRVGPPLYVATARTDDGRTLPVEFRTAAHHGPVILAAAHHAAGALHGLPRGSYALSAPTRAREVHV